MKLPMTAEERTLRARAAAHVKWAQTPDRAAATAAARHAAASGRWERQVDPDNTLSPDERARRAESAKRAYFADLGRKSSRARRETKVDSATTESIADSRELARLALVQLRVARAKRRVDAALRELAAAEMELRALDLQAVAG